MRKWTRLGIYVPASKDRVNVGLSGLVKGQVSVSVFGGGRWG